LSSKMLSCTFSIVLFLMFRVSKKCHKDFSLLHTYYTCYTSLFWVKSGSSVMCFHPILPFWKENCLQVFISNFIICKI
jgi:hypothetical protein